MRHLLRNGKILDFWSILRGEPSFGAPAVSSGIVCLEVNGSFVLAKVSDEV